MVRHNNQLPDNLPQLQNLIKRDPASYKDEFLQQYRHYQSVLNVFRLHPNEFNKSLDDLVMFIAQVSHCYPDVLSNYPQELVDILETYSSILDSAMRMTLCRALILLRNKYLLTPTDLLSLFFHLLRCHDKELRKFLETHIINDIKNMNAKHKNVRLNTTLQNFMFSMLKDSNSKAAKMSVAIMIELYKKNVWNDAKTVNVIATACFSKFTKVMVAALKFFLGSDHDNEKKSDDSDSDNEPSAKEVLMANKVNKKTRKREKQLKKVKQLIKKNQKKKSNTPAFSFSALHLVHDPQGLAEKLFQQLEKTNERFEVKIMVLDVVSRLIGLHHLFLLNYYPYIQRFIQPHQREVTKILQFAAQASHELVPPDVLEPVLKTLVNNFVTERNSADVIAIGLNAVREICSRCPLVMNEDLLRDLAQYKNYKERSVMMAARSLIHLYRSSMPELLHKKDRYSCEDERNTEADLDTSTEEEDAFLEGWIQLGAEKDGRPTEASVELKSKKYGEIDARDYIPGAEVLLQNNTEGTSTYEEDEEDDDNSSDGEWVDISHSSEDDTDKYVDTHRDSLDRKEVDQKHGAMNQDEKGDGDKADGNDLATEGKTEQVDRIQQAVEVSQMRLLTDEDFRKIDAARLSKEVTALKRGKKRPAEEETCSKGELVSLADIENIYKKRRHDKEMRQECVKKGQEGREKFGFQVRRLNPNSSKTNREKRKTKNYMMLKHKARGKLKRSFKEKQIALRNHLLRLRKMK